MTDIVATGPHVRNLCALPRAAIDGIARAVSAQATRIRSMWAVQNVPVLSLGRKCPDWCLARRERMITPRIIDQVCLHLSQLYRFDHTEKYVVCADLDDLVDPAVEHHRRAV